MKYLRLKLKKSGYGIIIPILACFLLAFNTVEESVKTVSGKVTGVEGKSLPGIAISGNEGETVYTDLQGNYSIVVSNDTKSLSFSFPGYRTAIATIPIDGSLSLILKKDKRFDGKSPDESTDIDRKTGFFPSQKIVEENGRFYLEGFVLNKENEPYTGVGVYILNALNEKIKTKTDEKGEFRIEVKSSTGYVVYSIPDENGILRNVNGKVF
ncbi:carboxypeptidase-like regulatory domain-containing protein [Ekhidna sp.]|uniref:carboxypeptidase-like regulatory domain-containing protein n=1 Tax=Ekhidna sp. TaxID=2608089 RepID=UPI003CCC1D3A